MAKTMTFAVMHVSVAFAVVWAMTGSWIVGSAVALVEPAINSVAYFFHEKAWERWQLREQQLHTLIGRLAKSLLDMLGAKAHTNETCRDALKPGEALHQSNKSGHAQCS